MTLNWNALKQASAHKNPYRWILFQDLIEDDGKDFLREEYPSNGRC